MTSPSSLLNEAAVAEWLDVKPATLERWRIRGGGPPFTKCGRAVRYQPEAVQAWLDGRTYDRTPVPTGRRST